MEDKGHETGREEASLVEVDDVEYSVVTDTCKDKVVLTEVRVVELKLLFQGEKGRGCFTVAVSVAYDLPSTFSVFRLMFLSED